MKNDFVDIKKEIRENFDPFFRHTKLELEPALQQMFCRIFSIEGDAPFIVHALTCKSIKSFSSVLLLTQEGYGEDALSVARSMVDATINAVLITENPDRASAYIDFRHILDYRDMLSWRKLNSNYAKNIFPPERVNEIEKNFLEFFPRFGINPKRPFFGSWHRSSVAKLSKELNSSQYPLTTLYTTVYRMGSDIVHGSIYDLIGRAQESDGKVMMETHPSINCIPESLIGAHGALLTTAKACNKALRQNFEKEMDDLAKNFSKLWSKKGPHS